MINVITITITITITIINITITIISISSTIISITIIMIITSKPQGEGQRGALYPEAALVMSSVCVRSTERFPAKAVH